MNLFKNKYRIVQLGKIKFKVQYRKWYSLFWKNDHCIYFELTYAQQRKKELIETEKFKQIVVG
jgi:hypothetical protein